MLFAVDIDGTIAGSSHGRHEYAQYLNRALALGLSDAQLETLGSYRAFAESDEVQSWVSVSQERQEAYKVALHEAQYNLDIQRARIPLPGSVEAMQRLSEHGTIIYVTLRKPYSERLTREWLARHGFPSPERAFCCEHFQYKLVTAHREAGEQEQVVMIDDHMKGLLGSFRTLAKEQYDIGFSLLRRIGFIVYGMEQLDPMPKSLQRFPLTRLMDWQKPPFYHFLEREFHELVVAMDYRQRQADPSK